MGTSTFTNRNWAIRFLGLKFGFEKHRIFISGSPYMDRFMLSIGVQIRLHRFYRGDDDRSPHSHMWSWWATFPFTSYLELVAIPGQTGYFEQDRDWWAYETRIVRAWRFHLRPSTYKHIVIGRADGLKKPFWTLCITGRKMQEWGFYLTPSKFIHHKDWS